MRFIVDECTGPAVGRWLRQQSHEVFSVYEEARGISDDEVLEKANAENRIVITNDKDFGEMVFRDKRRHRGVVLLRLQNETSASKIQAMETLLDRYADDLNDRFVVVTETLVRFG